MNEHDAVSRMVSKYPGGRAAIAARLGITEDVLRKRLSCQQGHKLGLAEARQIAEWCAEIKSEGYEALATVFAVDVGHMVRLPVIDQAPCLMTSMARSITEGSHVLTEITHALADDQLSENDFRRIEREVGENIAALAQTLAAARARFQRDTAHLREAA